MKSNEGRKGRWRILSRITVPLILLTVIFTACGRPRRGAGPPYTPEAALSTFQIERGFRIERFAAEPLVTSPVAMDIDEDGRIFVVEMPGYPLDTSGTGRIVMLEDTNGDGLPDRRTVFVDQLVLPTGVLRWKKGILVTDPPHVWYFEDSDGDGRADVRRIVLTGFAFTNPQHTVNGLYYGLDNRIYLAHEPPTTALIFKDAFGDRGSPIRFPDREDIPPLGVSGRNVAFRPDTYQLEALSGSSQFGHTFDEWGRRFTVHNANHARHEVLAARYLLRNPDLLAPTTQHNMSDHGNAAEVFPITKNAQHQMLTEAGQITSACGLTLYLGGWLPRSSFVAEPVHNLVHRDIWFDAGVTFTAKRVPERAEFLASSDPWFRPVNFYTSPDGALYVLDFYRPIIEHPEWMARAVYESQAIYHGSDRGRIYRVIPDGAPPAAAKKPIWLSQATDVELVEHLRHPNLWWRRTAQRLLVDRQNPAALPPLARLLKEDRSPLARVHALWTLDGLGKLTPAFIERALEDPEPGVRENAIQLAEPRLASSPALAAKLLRMAADPDAKVRFQLLCTLGYLDTAPARAVRKRLLLQDIEDEWTPIAALSASSDQALPTFRLAVTRLTGQKTKGRAAFFRQVCGMIAARQRSEEIRHVIQTVVRAANPDTEWWCAASIEGLARGAQARKKGAASWPVEQHALLKLHGSPAPAMRRASIHLLEVIGVSRDASLTIALKNAAQIAANPAEETEARVDAIRLLTLPGPNPYRALLKLLVEPQQPEAVRAAAVRSLGRIRGEEIGLFLLERWKTMTAKIRAEAADALLLEPGRIRLFLQAIQNDEVRTWMLGFRHRRRLVMHEDLAIRNASRALLEAKAEDRQVALQRFAAALQLDGNVARGEQVFKNLCARCHQMNGGGGRLGPDLATVRHRPPEALMTDILIPSQFIAQNYEVYLIDLEGGGMIDGVISAETPTTITLRHEDGAEDIIARKDIRDIRASRISAMPEDFDQQIDARQMADLLKFLKTTR